VVYQNKNYFQRRTKPKGPRTNDRIRALEVQVISSDKKNLGTFPIKQAIEMAKQEGLDLIEISPNANPPVCKITDLGKYTYDLKKKENKAKKKQKVVNLKEIKLRPVTEIHDYNFKLKNAQRFLQKGDKVKFTVKFKGREIQHTSLGNELMERIINDTMSVGKVEVPARLEGKQIVMIIQPL